MAHPMRKSDRLPDLLTNRSLTCDQDPEELIRYLLSAMVIQPPTSL
jgi:hypothetical protein